jgi:Uma2 family endonuclease
MAQLRFPRTSRPHPELRYVRAPEPLVFPQQASVPEGKAHLEVRTFLYKLLQFALGPEHSVGSEQFVYWIATSTDRCLAPDVFVKLGVPDAHFGTWQTWDRGGAPDLAVEIVSPTEREKPSTWDEKFAKYRELGVKELVRFDPEEPEGRRLRVWDRVEGDLVERVIADDRTPCLTLGLAWAVRLIPAKPDAVLGLRLVDDDGRQLETETERTDARAKAEAEARAQAEARADAEAETRAAAEARIRELEEQLRRARGEHG